MKPFESFEAREQRKSVEYAGSSPEGSPKLRAAKSGHKYDHMISSVDSGYRADGLDWV
jgi:hypothetical protein